MGQILADEFIEKVNRAYPLAARIQLGDLLDAIIAGSFPGGVPPEGVIEFGKDVSTILTLGDVQFKGTWDASTNTPQLGTGGIGGRRGHYYRVNVPGSTLIDGNNAWLAGDYIINEGGKWVQEDHSEEGIMTASNVGAGGVGVFKQKTGVDFEFRNINIASNKLSIVLDGINNEIDLDLVEANVVHQNLSGAGTNTHAQIDSHIANLSNPHVVTNAQVGLGNVTNNSQLIRSANDFTTFTAKTAPNNADVLLIEDSAAAFVKKQVSVENFPNKIGNVGFVTGRYYDNNMGVVAVRNHNTLAISANILYTVPIFIPRTQAFDRIGFEKTATAGDGNLRLGMYSVIEATGLPGNLVFEVGPILTNANQGYQLTISQTITAGWKWFAIVADTTRTIRTYNNADLIPKLGFSTLTEVDASTAAYVSRAHTFGALPSSFGAVTYETNNIPRILLRAA